METVESTQLLKVGDVARRLRLSRGTAYRLIQKGLIPSVRVGRSLRVDERKLEQWLDENGTQ